MFAVIQLVRTEICVNTICTDFHEPFHQEIMLLRIFRQLQRTRTAADLSSPASISHARDVLSLCVDCVGQLDYFLAGRPIRARSCRSRRDGTFDHIWTWQSCQSHPSHCFNFKGAPLRMLSDFLKTHLVTSSNSPL